MKLFGQQLRWSDPEHEAWKREQSNKYGWGGSHSIWTGKFILFLIFFLISVGIPLFFGSMAYTKYVLEFLFGKH
jgi:hypothetical protein